MIQGYHHFRKPPYRELIEFFFLLIHPTGVPRRLSRRPPRWQAELPGQKSPLMVSVFNWYTFCACGNRFLHLFINQDPINRICFSTLHCTFWRRFLVSQNDRDGYADMNFEPFHRYKVTFLPLTPGSSEPWTLTPFCVHCENPMTWHKTCFVKLSGFLGVSAVQTNWGYNLQISIGPEGSDEDIERFKRCC